MFWCIRLSVCGWFEFETRLLLDFAWFTSTNVWFLCHLVCPQMDWSALRSSAESAWAWPDWQVSLDWPLQKVQNRRSWDGGGVLPSPPSPFCHTRMHPKAEQLTPPSHTTLSLHPYLCRSLSLALINIIKHSKFSICVCGSGGMMKDWFNKIICLCS